MRPDFRLLHGHTISGVAYLNRTRLVKTNSVFPPWNRQSWEENEEVDFRVLDEEFDKDANLCRHVYRRKVKRGHRIHQSGTTASESERAPSFSQVFMSEVKQQVTVCVRRG